MSGETCRGDDVTRHMAEKQFHTCLNLFWRESFRVEVQRDDKRCVRIPVGEVERNRVGLEDLLFACGRAGERR